MPSTDKPSRPSTKPSSAGRGGKRPASKSADKLPSGVVSFEKKKRDDKSDRKGGKSFGDKKQWKDRKPAGDKDDKGGRVKSDRNVKKGDKDAPKGGAPVLNRRQKQKVSDLIKQLRINHAKLNMKKAEISNP